MSQLKKTIVKESRKTAKVRAKLAQHWKKQETEMTQEAIQTTIAKIHHWIAANAPHRVPLKNKEICLFDQNQNAAALSRKVQGIMQRIINPLLGH